MRELLEEINKKHNVELKEEHIKYAKCQVLLHMNTCKQHVGVPKIDFVKVLVRSYRENSSMKNSVINKNINIAIAASSAYGTQTKGGENE